MWRRVGAAISCAAWLLLACGKSEQTTPSVDDSAGSSMAGVTSASSGTGNSAGSAVSAGGAVAQAGDATTGGDTPDMGGRAAAGTAAGGETSAGGEASVGGAASCSGRYRACGCGCCGGQTSPPTCVYLERGDDLAALIAADVGRKSNLQACSAAGCSAGVEYVCCDSPAPSAEPATYTTSVFIGDIGRLSINKMSAPSGTDCSTLTLRQAVPGDPGQPGFALETPTGWAIEQATRQGCISSAVRQRAIGAIGKLSLRVVGNACVVDVHLALFFDDAAQSIDAQRFDADALPISVSVAECH